MSKKHLYQLVTGAILPFLLVFITFFVWSPYQHLNLVPASDSTFYTVNAYSDSINNSINASDIQWIEKKDSLLSFSYTLGNGNPHPFAGISIHAKGSSFFDVSSYDQLHLTIEASQGKRIQILLGVFATGYTHTDHAMTLRYLVKDLDLIKGQNHYSIPLDEFVTASWWYADHHVSEKDLKEVEFDKTKIINIQNCQILGKNIEDTISVRQLTFAKNTSAFYGCCFIFLCLYYLAWFIIYYFQQAKSAPIQKVEIHYNPILTQNSSDEEIQKVIHFISSHYQDSELSLKKIQMATGISEHKISILLKEKFSLPFKQYLNQLRLTEAKRLLQETELPVSDIAYKVGYGNISHFNRVFKDAEETSPNDFRKKIKR